LVVVHIRDFFSSGDLEGTFWGEIPSNIINMVCLVVVSIIYYYLVWKKKEKNKKIKHTWSKQLVH